MVLEFRCKLIPLLLTLCLLLHSRAEASQPGPLALGIAVGSPSGINMRYRLSASNAFDASLGWGVWSGIFASGAYTWRFPGVFESGIPKFEGYAGVGAHLISWRYNDCGFGWCVSSGGTVVSAHFPLGLAYQLERLPLEFFGQISPDFVVVPVSGLWLNASIGGRFYF